ncbi:MAG: DUF2877 domain-containing protein [Verrucomicrobiota bacterium]
MRILSVGDEVREGTYALHSRFSRAVSFTDGKRLVSLVTPEIGPGPLNIVIQDPATLLRHLADHPIPRRADTCRADNRRADVCRVDRRHLDKRHTSKRHLDKCLPDKRCGGSSRRLEESAQSALSSRQLEPRLSSTGLSVHGAGAARATRTLSAGMTRAGCNTALSPILRIGRYSVSLANRRWVFSRVHSYQSLLPIKEGSSAEVFRQNLQVLTQLLVREANPRSLAFLLDAKRARSFTTGFETAFVRRIKAGVRLLRRGHRAEGATLLRGCGFGLTPSGDDLLAGWLIGLNLLQQAGGRDFSSAIRAIYRAAKGRSLVCNAFLRLARDGRVNGNMRNLISALLRNGADSVRTAARRVLDQGETSGADLATGFVMATRSNCARTS